MSKRGRCLDLKKASAREARTKRSPIKNGLPNRRAVRKQIEIRVCVLTCARLYTPIPRQTGCLVLPLTVSKHSPALEDRFIPAMNAAPKHKDTRRRALGIEARLVSLLCRLGVGLFRCSVDGCLLEANEPMLALLGVDSVGPECSARLACLCGCNENWVALLQDAVESGQPQEREIEVCETSGKMSYFRLSVVSAATSGGDTLIDGVTTNISARRPSEANQARDTQARVAMLTARQKQVLDAVVKGKPNKAIARELQISEKTVEKHRANLMMKLEAKSLADLVRMALEAQSSGRPTS